MPTLVLNPQAIEVEAVIERRRRDEPVERSGLDELGPDELATRIDWP